CSLMPMEMFIPGRDLSFTYNCSTLRYAGLSGFSANKNVKLDSLENGVYMAAADAGSEGPDETGFGREELYNFYQFDEFFNLLHCLKGWSDRDLRIQKVSPFSGKKEAAAEKRRQYWLINNGKNGAVQYTDKPFGGDVFLIRNGVLTKCLKSDIICAEIPYGVTKIGSLAFSSCSTLEKVIIPDSVTEIGRGAFFKCRGLKSVNLPDSVNKIGEKAFLDCRNLVSIHLPKGLKHIPAYMLSLCRSLKELIIPDSVTVIDYESFSWSGIEKLKLPKNLKQLGWGACEHSNLTEITIPQSVETMGTKVFSDCSRLEKAVLPDILKVLPQKTFYRCEALREVQLPSKLVSIEKACFHGCKKLALLSFRENSGKNINILPETLEKIYGDVF
ncbi:MAG: leucine-rich repeat domain-containing protein, partial [Eubacterium sp.]|nr:leucine-rich repeat domain-containing protein [Eubacterium sp.]